MVVVILIKNLVFLPQISLPYLCYGEGRCGECLSKSEKWFSKFVAQYSGPQIYFAKLFRFGNKTPK